MAQYDGHKEVPDPTPVEMPLGYFRPEPLLETIRRLVQVESAYAEQEGLESFEEADDFEVGEGELHLASKYEMKDMEEEFYERERKSSPQGSRSSDRPSGDSDEGKKAEKESEKPVEAAQGSVEKVAQ